MVKRIVLYFSLVMVSGFVSAQTKLETLRDSLQQLSNESLEYLEVLVLLAHEYAATDPDTSLILCDQIYELSKTRNDRALGRAYLSYGISYSYLADYAKSAEYTFKAVKEAEKHRDTLALIDAFNNLGINAIYEEDYDQSSVYFQKVLHLSEKIRDSLRLGHVLNNLGMIEGYQGRLESELNYYGKAAGIFLKIDEWEGLGNTVLNAGTVFTTTGKYEEAAIFYDSAERIFQKLGYYSGVQNAVLSKAENFLKQKNFKKAVPTALAALEMAETYNFVQDEVYSYELLTDIYKEMGQFDKAFEYHEKYFSLKEEVFNAEKASQISELTIKYKTAQKEKEILKANAEIARKAQFQKYLIIVIGILIVFGCLFFYLLTQRFRLKKDLLSQEIDTLRAQIDTFFGGDIGQIDLTLNRLNQGLHKSLTEREFEILNLAVSDKSNHEIADTIHISINTVKFHLRNIYEKLGVSNRKEALAFVLKKT